MHISIHHNDLRIGLKNLGRKTGTDVYRREFQFKNLVPVQPGLLEQLFLTMNVHAILINRT